MDDQLNPAKTYLDVAYPIHNASPDELRQLLSKYNQEAAVRIDADGEVSFDILDESKRSRIENGKTGHNYPHLGGIPITFKEGDRVKTKDGRGGTVLGSDWVGDLVLYRYNDEPRMGYFIVRVDFGDHIEYHIRNDLLCDRFRKL